MPFLYFHLCCEREGLLWNLDRKTLPSIRILDREIAHSILYKRHMLLRAQKYLYRLPCHKALRCEGRDGGGFEGVAGRLEGMLAAYGCIDPGD